MAQLVDRSRAFRRTRRTAVVVGTTIGLTLMLTQPGSAATNDEGARTAAADFSPGTGSAIALGYKVNPTFGGLSFGITAGESVAGHQNTAATGQSQSIDLGVIGVSLAAEGCNGAAATYSEEKQPQAVIVSSDDPGAAQGKKANLANGISQFASATKTPFATAITTVAPEGNPAVAQMGGSISTATSGVVGGNTRQAKAVTDIAELKLLGGLVTIGDMHWEAVQQTGGTNVSQGTFEIGSLTVAGKKVPISGDSASQAKTMKTALNALGFTVDPPEVRVDKGIVFVDPLRIGIVPSDLRDGLLLGPALSALQPVREAAIKQLLRTGCNGDLSGVYVVPVSTMVTILDLAVGSISGAGSLTLELGGVQASTAAIDGFSGLGAFTPLTPPVVTPSFDNSAVDTPSVDTPSFDTGDTVAPSDGSTATTPDQEEAAPTVEVASVDGGRGGKLLGVGLGGLLLLLASAEGDRRKMRRAQREIPLEA